MAGLGWRGGLLGRGSRVRKADRGGRPRWRWRWRSEWSRGGCALAAGAAGAAGGHGRGPVAPGARIGDDGHGGQRQGGAESPPRSASARAARAAAALREVRASKGAVPAASAPPKVKLGQANPRTGCGRCGGPPAAGAGFQRAVEPGHYQADLGGPGVVPERRRHQDGACSSAAGELPAPGRLVDRGSTRAWSRRRGRNRGAVAVRRAFSVRRRRGPVALRASASRLRRRSPLLPPSPSPCCLPSLSPSPRRRQPRRPPGGGETPRPSRRRSRPTPTATRCWSCR